MVMEQRRDWRCVMVPPPNPLAAIGGALRSAFPVTGTMRALDAFSALLARLDRK